MKRLTDYQSLSSAELEALLCSEVETSDPAAALAILAELESRQSETIAPDEEWNRFCQHYLPTPLDPPGNVQRTHRVSRFRQLGLTAAAACLACMLAVHAGSIDILRTMIHWTGDALYVESPDVTEEHSSVSDTTDAALKAASTPAAAAGVRAKSTACASLEEALSLLELERWTPTAIPAGYSFSSAEVETLEGVEALHALYTNDAGDLLQFNCRRYGENTVFSSVIIKDDEEVETLSLGGTTCYFLSNGRYEGAVWMADEKTEFHISGPVSREELKDMICSISP